MEFFGEALDDIGKERPVFFLDTIYNTIGDLTVAQASFPIKYQKNININIFSKNPYLFKYDAGDKNLHFDEFKFVIKSLIGHHWDDAIYELNRRLN